MIFKAPEKRPRAQIPDFFGKLTMIHFRKSFTKGWMEERGGDRPERFQGTLGRMLTDDARSEVLISSIAALAVMGSQDTFAAMVILRRVNKRLHKLIDIHFTPHLIDIPRNVNLRNCTLIPFHLQHRWRAANPGRDVPCLAWNMYRELDSYHALRTKSGRSYAAIRATDEAAVDEVALAEPDETDARMLLV
jgi:hypothetical protein